MVTLSAEVGRWPQDHVPALLQTPEAWDVQVSADACRGAATSARQATKHGGKECDDTPMFHFALPFHVVSG